jgi:outer membrane protein OmpA-like peptidoglycan-associated protein
MFRSSLRRKLCAATLISFFAAVTGCASPPHPAVCAAIGAAALGGTGGYLGHRSPGHDGDEIGGFTAAGVVLGGGAGYLICRALQKEEAPPPPPMAKPAPPPAPKPAPAPVEERIVLRGVNFDFDKADIRPDAAVILDEAASLLNSSPSGSVQVAGHTDSVGADAYNQSLSERRAASVRDYLVAHGVAASRLSTVGYGESKPIASNDTADGRALNRRVELNLD